MALKDLKSDLSKFRKPFKPNPIAQQEKGRQIKPFTTTPLADRATPDVVNKQTASDKKGVDVNKNVQPTGRHTKGVDVDNASNPTGRHTEGKDVTNTVRISGRHTEGANVENKVRISGRHTTGVDVDNTSVLSGRHETGKDVDNTSALSGRHTSGKDVDNTSVLSGRHTSGKDVDNTSAISGRHTVGKDVTNSSVISGRHESDNSNFNIDGQPTGKSPIGRHDSGDTSNFNIDGASTLTNPRGRHDGPDTSNFNIDGTPTPTNPAGRHDGPDTSNLNYDGTISITNPRGRHDSGDTSIHNIDGVPVGTNPGGRHESDNSILNIDGSPTPTIPGGRHEIDNSNFNIDGAVPNTNPIGRHETSPTLPNEVNYFTDIHSTGFTSNFQPGTPTKYNIGSSQLQTPLSGPLAVDFIGNSAASGFTIKQQNTSIVGIDNNTYTLPNSVAGGRLWNVGKSKLEAQLGEGTFVPGAGALVGHDVKLFVSAAGFSAGRRYEAVVGKNKVSALGYQYVQKNSPSFFDIEYNKFNLREDSPQYGWIDSPLILRGIQRKNNSDPQRWGFGLGFDDGLIRGGAVTALERSLIDTARIAKWMASPKGLLWIVKQVGLGLTNAKVETNPLTPGPFGRQTRIHTGLASLLSVPGTAFGLHFTRHGIPFVNELASYEAVQFIKKGTQQAIGDSALKSPLNPANNRLVSLYKDPTGLNNGSLFNGAPILQLSGLAGPHSVYGIGASTIRRYVNTKNAQDNLAFENILKNGEYDGLFKYEYLTQYASLLSTSTYKSVPKFAQQRGRLSIENTGLKDLHIAGEKQIPLSPFKDKYPFTTKPTEANPVATPIKKDGVNVVTGIKAYSTLAYNKLKRNNEGETTNIDDFRDRHEVGALGDESYFRSLTADYQTNNLREKFGWGDQGKVNNNDAANRSDYTKTHIGPGGSPLETFRGDLVNLADAGQYATDTLYDDIGAKDFVPLFFTGPRLSRGTQKEETLVFRATVGNISDNFSPSWNSTQILGRADAVHTYNSWARTFSFDFKVFATSRDEMKPLWRKLNYLASWTAPNYKSGHMRGPYMRITLGNLFQETPCFINSLTYNIDDQTTWEINLEEDEEMLQLPHGVNVNMSLTMLMDYRPQWSGRMYSMSDRGRANDRSEKVNWLWDSSIEGNKGLIGDRAEEVSTRDSQDSQGTEEVDGDAYTENGSVNV